MPASRTTAFADRVFAAFPAWRALACLETDGHGTASLVIEVPPPGGSGVESGIFVLFEHDEITIGLDGYHTHFNRFAGQDFDAEAQAAVDFLGQLVEERLAIISWRADARVCASGTLRAGESPTDQVAPVSGVNRISVRSWRGSLNADIDV